MIKICLVFGFAGKKRNCLVARKENRKSILDTDIGDCGWLALRKGRGFPRCGWGKGPEPFSL